MILFTYFVKFITVEANNFKASTMHARYRTTSISINQIASTVLPATCMLPAIATASISYLGVIQISIGAISSF